jgi:hypothetical protein
VFRPVISLVPPAHTLGDERLGGFAPLGRTLRFIARDLELPAFMEKTVKLVFKNGQRIPRILPSLRGRRLATFVNAAFDPKMWASTLNAAHNRIDLAISADDGLYSSLRCHFHPLHVCCVVGGVCA